MGQAELAKLADVGRNYVTEIEAGRTNPSLLKIRALAAALKISPAKLLENADAIMRGDLP